MDIGLNLKWLAPHHPGEQIIAMATTAESLGFHSIWVSEHIAIPLHIETKDPYEDEGRLTFTPETAHAEAMVLLGYVAGATKRLRLGTYVIPAINRDPLSLAKQWRRSTRSRTDGWSSASAPATCPRRPPCSAAPSTTGAPGSTR